MPQKDAHHVFLCTATLNEPWKAKWGETNSWRFLEIVFQNVSNSVRNGNNRRSCDVSKSQFQHSNNIWAVALRNCKNRLFLRKCLGQPDIFYLTNLKEFNWSIESCFSPIWKKKAGHPVKRFVDLKCKGQNIKLPRSFFFETFESAIYSTVAAEWNSYSKIFPNVRKPSLIWKNDRFLNKNLNFLRTSRSVEFAVKNVKNDNKMFFCFNCVVFFWRIRKFSNSEKYRNLMEKRPFGKKVFILLKCNCYKIGRKVCRWWRACQLFLSFTRTL